MTLLYLIGLSFLVERASLVMTSFNYGARFNGLGAVDGVIKRDGAAPMVYRVLVPWLMLGLQKLGVRKLEAYQILKLLFTFIALYAVSVAWSFEAAVITALLLPVTFLYDYWDWSIELAGVALGMTGRIELAILGVIMLAMSRETFVLVGLALWVSSGDSLGALLVISMGGAVWLMVRMIQGEHKLYCKRIMLVDNLKVLFNLIRKRPWFLSAELASLVLILWGAAFVLSGVSGWPVVAVVIGTGFIMGRVEETRVFASILPFLAGMF